jgi:hypothetical protein
VRTPVPPESYHYVLRRIAAGISIRSACRELKQRGERGLSAQGFLKWCEKSPSRREQYLRAKARGIEILADEMHEILDNAGNGTKDAALFNAEVNKAKARVWARQWTASKLLHKTYGDKLQHEHSGSVSVAVVTGVPLDAIPLAQAAGPGVLGYSLGLLDAGDADAAPAVAARVAEPVRLQDLLD